MNMKRSMEVSRKDIVTKEILKRKDLIRISISSDGTTNIDKDFNMGGRGIYISKSSIKIGLEKKIIKKNINRFGGDINSIIDELMKEAKNGK